MPPLAEINPKPTNTMKLIILCLALCSVTAEASWFSKKPDPLDVAQEKITALENQVSSQASSLNRWQMTAGSLGIACILTLIIGTALGAKTRHHHESSRRLGPPPPTTHLNGRSTSIVDQAAEEEGHPTLAA